MNEQICETFEPTFAAEGPPPACVLSVSLLDLQLDSEGCHTHRRALFQELIHVETRRN